MPGFWDFEDWQSLMIMLIIWDFCKSQEYWTGLTSTARLHHSSRARMPRTPCIVILRDTAGEKLLVVLHVSSKVSSSFRQLSVSFVQLSPSFIDTFSPSMPSSIRWVPSILGRLVGALENFQPRAPRAHCRRRWTPLVTDSGESDSRNGKLSADGCSSRSKLQ